MSNTRTTTTTTTVPVLDATAQRLACLVPARLGVSGAGAFWITGTPGFWDAWAEPGAFVVRLGRLELVADRASAPAV